LQRVLVIDDEEHLRAVLQRVLRRDHDVVAVASGREAQQLLERDAAFDVVLCDLMMPELSGTELHAWLVTHDPALADKVVFVSGGALTPEASEYLDSVKNRQLGKPFESAELRRLVAQMVEQRRPG
jgi:CheY-like chemotaxis protein